MDALIDTLIPLLDKGDTLIDGGNANFHDTVRRSKKMAEHGLMYIGMGVSGGEEGALSRPQPDARRRLQGMGKRGQLFDGYFCQSPQRRALLRLSGEQTVQGISPRPCITVSNTAIWNCFAETYQFMRNATDMTCDQMGDVFAKWNEGMLGGYLTTITSKFSIQRKRRGAGSPRSWTLRARRAPASGR